ncbi:MAG: diacylglycerol/lipid kinase family protein [Butyrivibrio sp.]
MLHVFIINSFAGSGDFADSLREKLSTVADINYLVFNSEYPGDEGVLAREIYELFEDETIRFYACGGSGTFRNIVKGLPEHERAEFAEIPYGASNDFLMAFGKVKDRFLDIDDMIRGRAVMIDYMKSNMGPACNSVSTGFDVQMIKTASHVSDSLFFGGPSSYVIGGIRALFKKCWFDAEICADGIRMKGRYDTFLAVNGCRVGSICNVGTDGSPFDGRIEMLLLPHRNFFGRMMSLIALTGNNQKYIDRHSVRLKASHIRIDFKNMDNVECNFDGELDSGEYLEVEVVPRGLRFVIPSGMEVNYEN